LTSRGFVTLSNAGICLSDLRRFIPPAYFWDSASSTVICFLSRLTGSILRSNSIF
jgi:hypothetical protein